MSRDPRGPNAGAQHQTDAKSTVVTTPSCEIPTCKHSLSRTQVAHRRQAEEQSSRGPILTVGADTHTGLATTSGMGNGARCPRSCDTALTSGHIQLGRATRTLRYLDTPIPCPDPLPGKRRTAVSWASKVGTLTVLRSYDG